jgi:hypothetical protein
MWTIKYNGEEKTLAEWGVKNVRRVVVSQDIDTVTFDQPHATALDDPLFEEEQIVEIFRDEVRWFYGRAEDAAPYRSGGEGGLRYTISGPWWWLANSGFRQSWKYRPDLTQSVLEEVFIPYCLLGTKVDGTQQTIASQITEAINYLITQGAPLAFDGQGLPEIFPPIKDVWNAPVAEVIQKMIEWTPDIVCWFDYTTEPYPTLRMRRRADQGAVELDLGKPFIVPDWEIKGRGDLKVPGVIIYYIRTDSTNGSVYTVISEDKFPAETTGREPKALLAAINLEGANVTFLEQTIDCKTIQAESADWWKSHHADLHGTAISALSIKPGSATFFDEEGNVLVPLPRELFGLWAPWMGGQVKSTNVRALASWTEHVDGEPALTVVDRPIVCSLTATDLVSGTFKSAPEGEAGEPQPFGLAEAIYKASSVKHYEGRIRIKEQTCSDRIAMGNVLNVTGGRSEWVGMRAQVQGIEDHVDSGLTTVVFGPPRQLGPSGYIELLRATRNRFRYAAPASRATGIAGSSAAILGKEVSKQVATAGQGGVTLNTMLDPTGTIPGKVIQDLRSINGKEIKFREVTICDNAVEKKMILLCSEPYLSAQLPQPTV